MDALFRSTAQVARHHATGVILTGMGDDGAQGMLEMKEAGSFNIAQDEASSVVYGMPKIALSKGGVDEVHSLNEIPHVLVKHSPGPRAGVHRISKEEADTIGTSFWHTLFPFRSKINAFRSFILVRFQKFWDAFGEH